MDAAHQRLKLPVFLLSSEVLLCADNINSWTVPFRMKSASDLDLSSDISQKVEEQASFHVRLHVCLTRWNRSSNQVQKYASSFFHVTAYMTETRTVDNRSTNF